MNHNLMYPELKEKLLSVSEKLAIKFDNKPLTVEDVLDEEVIVYYSDPFNGAIRTTDFFVFAAQEYEGDLILFGVAKEIKVVDGKVVDFSINIGNIALSKLENVTLPFGTGICRFDKFNPGETIRSALKKHINYES